MGQKTLRKRLTAILSAMLIVSTCSVTAMADEEYSNYSAESLEPSQNTGITSEDWAELQSEIESKVNSQNSQKSKNSPSTNKDGEDGFKSFKEGKYIGSGEWLLAIGIILIVLGIAGIGFIAFMMFRRKKLVQAMAMRNRRRVHAAGNPKAVHSNNNSNSSGRIAPKNNRSK